MFQLAQRWRGSDPVRNRLKLGTSRFALERSHGTPQLAQVLSAFVLICTELAGWSAKTPDALHQDAPLSGSEYALFVLVTHLSHLKEGAVQSGPKALCGGFGFVSLKRLQRRHRRFDLGPCSNEKEGEAWVWRGKRQVGVEHALGVSEKTDQSGTVDAIHWSLRKHPGALGRFKGVREGLSPVSYLLSVVG